MPLTYITSIFFATTNQQVEPEENGKLEEDWQLVSNDGDVVVGGDTGALPGMESGSALNPKDGRTVDTAGKAGPSGPWGTRTGLSFAAIATETIQCQSPPAQKTQPGLSLADKTVDNAAAAKDIHARMLAGKKDEVRTVALTGSDKGHACTGLSGVCCHATPR